MTSKTPTSTTASKSVSKSGSKSVSTTSSSIPPVAGWRGRLERATTDRRMRHGAMIVGALVLLAIIVGPTLKAYIGQKQQISALREQVTAQEKVVDELKAEQARWQDPAYVEQQARQRLKFVKVGEKAYTVLDPEDTQAIAPGMAQASKDSAWYATIWSSLEAADAPAAAK